VLLEGCAFDLLKPDIFERSPDQASSGLFSPIDKIEDLRLLKKPETRHNSNGPAGPSSPRTRSTPCSASPTARTPAVWRTATRWRRPFGST